MDQVASTPKRKRGRPKGSGLADEQHLTRAADLICREPGIPVTTALKRIGNWNDSELRRLRDKFSRDRERLLADAKDRRLDALLRNLPAALEVLVDRGLAVVDRGLAVVDNLIDLAHREDVRRFLEILVAVVAPSTAVLEGTTPGQHTSPRTPSEQKPPDPSAAAVGDAAMRLDDVEVGALTPNRRNTRTHSKRQIRQIARSIEEFGFTAPLIIDENNMVLAGHGRLEAAKIVGMSSVPCLRVRDWSEAQKAAYAIADNKIALNAGWDEALLLEELEALIELDFDVDITGFDAVEIDSLVRAEAPEDSGDPRDDALPEPSAGPPVTRAGDLWICGEHRLICGDARHPTVYAELMQGEKAEMIFTDPPYNVPISGHVGGLGRTKHREFAMASGEMSEAEFTGLLQQTLAQLAANSTDGSIHFICMDWRHMAELQRAGGAAYSELKNVVVWVKDNGGMGSFYRSRHELIFAFKKGTAPHINNFELGQRGRYRTNVWQYRGVNSGGASRLEELALHPTVKPVALVADALQDCSRRGGIVLDAFCGSGTILVAAEKTRRRARAVEIDESYCDTAIRRWQTYAKDDAILAATGETFDAVRRRRHEEESTAQAVE